MPFNISIHLLSFNDLIKHAYSVVVKPLLNLPRRFNAVEAAVSVLAHWSHTAINWCIASAARRQCEVSSTTTETSTTQSANHSVN